jgi:hypothetical protein
MVPTTVRTTRRLLPLSTPDLRFRGESGLVVEAAGQLSRPRRTDTMVTSEHDRTGGAEDAVKAFALALRKVRRRAGEPSFRAMARKTHYSVSTLTRAFGGKNFPRWQVVEDLLDLFMADQTTRQAIKDLWCDIADVLEPLAGGFDPPPPGPTEPTARPMPDRDNAVTGGKVCRLCGAFVVDEVQHRQWHAAYMRRDPPTPRRAS